MSGDNLGVKPAPTFFDSQASWLFVTQARSQHYPQTKGRTAEAIILVMSPTTAMVQAIMEKFIKVSLTVMPLILPMIQKPLSFIHGTGLAPNPITMAR